MTDMTNPRRALAALAALEAYGAHLGNPLRPLELPEYFDEAVGDLLGNLHHYVLEQLKGPRSQEWFEYIEGEDVTDVLDRLLERGHSYYRDELNELLMISVPEDIEAGGTVRQLWRIEYYHGLEMIAFEEVPMVVRPGDTLKLKDHLEIEVDGRPFGRHMLIAPPTLDPDGKHLAKVQVGQLEVFDRG